MSLPVPFARQDELFTFEATETVPGHPYLRLKDTASVSRFLVAELSTERLKDMYKILFLTSKPRNISPLHHQTIKGRRILVTEKPELHLITCPGQILVKPLPRWLMSHSFAATYVFHKMPQQESLASEAHGFLRTYASLIQHESDLEIPKKEKLLPCEVEWDAWCRFINPLKYPFVTSSEYVEARRRKTSNAGRHLPTNSVPLYADSLVGPRYHYGEIGLVRLNLWCFLTFREWEYLPVHFNYGTYFARYLAPYLFVFGGLTVILTAMQVGLAAGPDGPYSQDLISRFVALTIAVTVIGCGFFPVMYILFAIRELYFYFIYFRPQI